MKIGIAEKEKSIKKEPEASVNKHFLNEGDVGFSSKIWR
jgi:hypothetical protein